MIVIMVYVCGTGVLCFDLVVGVALRLGVGCLILVVDWSCLLFVW